jgi:hypothetical protein
VNRLLLVRPYLDKYRACSCTEDVEQVQIEILRELEESWLKARENGGRSLHSFFPFDNRDLTEAISRQNPN